MDNQTYERKAKEYLHQFRLLRSERMATIRQRNVPVQCTMDIRYEFFEVRNRRRIVIYLPSSGCEWSFNHRRCNMCGHYLAQGGKPIKPELLINAFRAQIEQIEWDQYPIVNIYNNGSFLNENEIPNQVRNEILAIITQIPDIKMVVIESRPQYITQENVRQVSLPLCSCYDEWCHEYRHPALSAVK